MLGFFLLWFALLIVLFIVVATPLPDRLRAFGLIGMVMTIWILWALYGVELLANLKWPLDEGHAHSETGSLPKQGASSTSIDPPTARLGQVGDLFGGINALFAALAFAGVGIAAFQQWKSTRIAFKQSIEATFFSAVELHHRIADGLRFDRVRIFPAEQRAWECKRQNIGAEPPPKPDSASGRQVFPEVIRAISYNCKGSLAYENLMANYRALQDKHNYVLGHYFRNLYQILKLIDTDEALDEPGRQKYASFLRAQLSSDELALLMVNCSSDTVDSGEFRALIVRYRLLEHIPLKRAKNGYHYTGQVRQVNDREVVLADDASIQEYLVEPAVQRRSRSYRGAFGTNPAFERD